MIGQLINQFDNLPENENTVAKFNELFAQNLLDEPSKLLEIGDILTGGLREIFIEDIRQTIDLQDKQCFVLKPYLGKYKYEVRRKGELIKVVSRTADLSEFIDMSDSSISTYVGIGRTDFGNINIKKVLNDYSI